MIGKLSGRLDWRGADQVLIDVRGVGYIVYVSDRTLANLGGVGEPVSLYTELMVREDLLQLFGFPSMLEKEWHRLLTTVQGVGACHKVNLQSVESISGNAQDRLSNLWDDAHCHPRPAQQGEIFRRRRVLIS